MSKPVDEAAAPPAEPHAERAPAKHRAGWIPLHPEPLPQPTSWPATLAFAVTFLLWGIVSSPFITGVGLVLLIVSLAGWIGDIRHETRLP
jgi:hypothetical protein